MRASDVMENYPSIDETAPAEEAVRMIGQERRPAVLVLRDSKPLTVLPGSQVLNFLIPGYLQEDPSLVKVYGEKASDACAERLAGRTVGDMLPKERRLTLPSVRTDANIMECAAVMAAQHSPLLVVVDENDDIAGAISASRLLQHLLP